MGLYNSKQHPKEIQNIYSKIIKLVNNTSYHIDVKRYLLEKQIKILKSLAVKNSFNYLIFPDQFNIFHLFGVFGPFDIKDDRGVEYNGSDIFSAIRILYYKSKNGYITFEYHIDSFYPQKTDNLSMKINNDNEKCNSISTLYESIIETLQDSENAFEVSRYKLNKNINNLKKYQIYNLLTGFTYPDNNNCVIISGIFGPFNNSNMEGYITLNILYYKNDTTNEVEDCKNYNIFNPIYKIPKPIEINVNDINRSIKYDENGIPIPPPSQNLQL